jgi:excisionase family DNA binding protein
MTTLEACHYLRISRPTYLKCLYSGKIKGTKVGKGWKVLKSELDRFLTGGDGSFPGAGAIKYRALSSDHMAG